MGNKKGVTGYEVYDVVFGAWLLRQKETRRVQLWVDVVLMKLINYYEELRFERPEYRELYQHKMNATTFVPQNVRANGRRSIAITLKA
ncbi:hypothetical protein DVH05_002642 [Phytophthora capsici]|nr:hypothetical protein DVH05_002642 [Phytophthora capsici]